jgi:hypothetical protein
VKIAGGSNFRAPEREESKALKHRNIEYGIEEDVPGLWRYIIYPKIGTGERVYGDAKYRTREDAVQAAIYEINNGLERSRKPSG